ncbi:NAD(P)/FAD-dependent oxidoreductase [Aeromicrobium wangtongii]|uniref:NAD(P)/FAD-dependent oxidoreductase n=1 Tax=Aeromicrobium wangtongii TaxID=2969247 RepID=A0ABY5MCF6_9ACTN|nr:NAD(P)/FAD-dependent oxidoreductase [Aeromicrobium wangtongii]MCD9197357.1 NAD(P)/FAD-dependent oxidoreductase [Aeromicrobium wangtongii]UUP14851.1 NAD(P)/FAD-dependent oxidoreductase [Aeromicrobium wangtongii]
MFDTIVIGGGPAGLQAALTLGRMHRSVLLLDSGHYRNGTVEHMQNFITHDGRDPADLRLLARKDIAAYATVEIRDTAADAVRQVEDGFEVVLGDETVSSRTIVLATGVRDTLPDVRGVAEAWGREIASCPFCHGHELAQERVALLGAGAQSAHLAALLAGVGGELVVLADGVVPEPEVTDALAQLGVAVRPEKVEQVDRVEGGLRVRLVDAEPLEVGGMFVETQIAQSAPFAEQLGLALLPSGCVEIDVTGRTSLPGVFAAGDLAHTSALPGPMPSVAGAISAGLVAAAMCHMDLAHRG